MKVRNLKLISLILALAIVFGACGRFGNKNVVNPNPSDSAGITLNGTGVLSADDIPAFDGKQPYVTVNSNTPSFKKSDLTKNSYEKYGELDRYGRCTECVACIGTDLMPSEERESIASVEPAGWHSYSYSYIDGGSLYNRCHLIAYMLAGENANEKNLITGTRYMNIEGMLPFEEETGDYVTQTKNHVLYRVTPVYKGDELVARGVQMEAYSVEDNGQGVCFNVFCYNVQPNIIIDYKTGSATEKVKTAKTTTQPVHSKYVLNKKSKKIHKPSCKGVQDMSEKNKEFSDKSREELIAEGYSPCGECNP